MVCCKTDGARYANYYNLYTCIFLFLLVNFRIVQDSHNAFIENRLDELFDGSVRGDQFEGVCGILSCLSQDRQAPGMVLYVVRHIIHLAVYYLVNL